MTAPTSRFTDPSTGVVAEVGTDGVPVGLAVPDGLLTRPSAEVARAVLRSLTAAAGQARVLLEEMSEQVWEEQENEEQGNSDQIPGRGSW